MRVLVTGICGFVGSAIAFELKRLHPDLEVLGFDNLSRPGSEQNRALMRARGIRFFHGDIRNPSDLEVVPKADWVIDASANPSVLAGVRGLTSSRQLLEHNLIGTINLLEFCKAHSAGFLLLSTSRVYSMERLAAFPMTSSEGQLVPRFEQISDPGLSTAGVAETFSTQAPISLYGAAKLASEQLAFEYAHAFELPVQVNRCGVLAGAGQFGKPDQGIFSFWIHSYRARRPLKYIGFDGSGGQTRDCLHPRDLAQLVSLQLHAPRRTHTPLNVGGGRSNSLSLAQLSRWCAERFGEHSVAADPVPRPYDVPWLVLDSSRAATDWHWKPATPIEAVLEEIGQHAAQNPDWLELSRDS